MCVCLGHVGINSTALNHDSRDNEIEYSAVIVTLVCIAFEVCTRNGSRLSVKLNNNSAVVSRNSCFHGMQVCQGQRGEKG